VATTCLTEVNLTSGDSTTVSATDKNVVRLKAITIPDYIGRRTMDAFRTMYYGLGWVGVGDRDTGDPVVVHKISVLPFEIALPVGFVGNIWFQGDPNTTIGVRACTRT
jgi:hypothetical protein